MKPQTAFDFNKVFALLTEKMSGYSSDKTNNTDATIDFCRRTMTKQLLIGINTVFDKVREQGISFCNEMLGVNTRWGTVSLARGSALYNSITEAIKPQIDQLAQEVIDNNDFSLIYREMTAKTKKELIRAMKAQYIEEVHNAIQCKQLAIIRQQAVDDVNDMWNKLSTLSNSDIDVNEIIADQFTQYIANDLELQKENNKKYNDILKQEVFDLIIKTSEEL